MSLQSSVITPNSVYSRADERWYYDERSRYAITRRYWGEGRLHAPFLVCHTQGLGESLATGLGYRLPLAMGGCYSTLSRDWSKDYMFVLWIGCGMITATQWPLVGRSPDEKESWCLLWCGLVFACCLSCTDRFQPFVSCTVYPEVYSEVSFDVSFEVSFDEFRVGREG